VKRLHFSKFLDLDFAFEKSFWTVVRLGPSFKKSGLDLDRKIWQSAHFRCQAKFPTSRHVHMHRVVFCISNRPTLRKPNIRT